MGFRLLITHLVVPVSGSSFVQTGFSSLQLETILTSKAQSAWYLRTSENLLQPIHFLVHFFCFISNARKLFSAKVLTEVKQNMLLWYSVCILYECIFYFFLLDPCILFITCLPFCKHLILSNSDSEKNSLSERNAAEDPNFTNLYQWFPVLQQLNFPPRR